MKTVYDEVFGDMIYDYSWEKTEDFSAFGKEHEVGVVAEAYGGDKIVDVQRDSYKTYKKNFSKYITKVPDVLLKYYVDNYDIISSNIEIPEKINIKNINRELVVKLIKVRTVYFDRKGRFGWLCDCAWDSEHGVCIVLSEDPPIVTEQDYML